MDKKTETNKYEEDPDMTRFMQALNAIDPDYVKYMPIKSIASLYYTWTKVGGDVNTFLLKYFNRLQ